MIDHYIAFLSFRHCRGVTELIVALRGEIYFVKFIINLEEEDVEPGVILGRTFLRMTKAITDFGVGTVIIYPEFDPYMEDIEEEEKRTSSSAGGHLTQEEAKKEALAIIISQKFALLEEVRPVIKTMAYHDKYKKVLDEIWKDKVELDGKIIGGTVRKREMKKVDKGITMINHTQAEALGILTNVLCQ
ncbi:hypothetical protein Tco_1444913, partial [Tanacetum coccineum]